MADETLGFTVKIDGIDKQISNLKEFKLAIKQAKDEQVQAALQFGESSKQYQKASAAVGDLKEKFKGLGEQATAMQGGGIEKAENSLRLFGEGLKGLDFDKVKAGLAGFKGALAATGVMLIVEGVSYLIENFDELSKGSGILGKALRVVGDIIGVVKDGIIFLTDAIGITNSALDKLSESAIKNAETSKAALDDQAAAYDRQTKVMSASGKRTIEVEIAKQDAIIRTNKAIMDQIAAAISAGGEFGDEQKKILIASTSAIKNAVADKQAILAKDVIDTKKKEEDKYKNWKTIHDKKIADDQALFDTALAEGEKEQAEQARRDAIDKKKAEGLAKEAEEKKKADQKDRDDAINAGIENAQKLSDNLKKIAADEEKAKADIRTAGFNTAKGLEELIGQIALNRAKGNAAAELDIRKKMFAVDKAFNVARAIQDGIRSVQAALTLPPPFGEILAGVNAGLAAVNVGKILATKFDGGGSAGSASISSPSSSTPNIGGGMNTSAPSIPQQTQQSTQYNNGQKQAPIEAIVMEGQSRSVTDRVNKLNRQAEY